MGMYIIFSIENDRKLLRYSYPALILLAIVTYTVFREFIFLQPDSVLLLSPFSFRDPLAHMVIFYLLCAVVISLPVLTRVLSISGTKGKWMRLIMPSSIPVMFLITVILLVIWNDTKIAKLFRLEKSVYERDWDAVINDQEKYRLKNLVAEYYYNLALAEKGELCDRMFRCRQDFGPASLIIPWDSKMGANNIDRGVYFFYTAGLINEAHRWAYESMVGRGFRPENLKMLIKTDLINGHYTMAKKYLGILKQTLHYRSWAKKYERLLNHPGLISADQELGGKMKIKPVKDFQISIRNPQTNLQLLLDSNPYNKTAFEYLMAWYMLEKNITTLGDEAGRMRKLSYPGIPRHIEEALIMYNIGAGMMPDLGRLKISQESVKRFRKYELFADPALGFLTKAGKTIPAETRETFWYYFDSK